MSKPNLHRKRSAASAEVRIIGGRFRGRTILYHGDPATRPMKHRTREAIFNLISTAAKGRHVIDLFAGTGALGLEAMSRGAIAATFIEKHVPTARIVRQNAETLGVLALSTVYTTSAFLWGRRDLPHWISSEQEAGCDIPGRERIALEAVSRTIPASASTNPWLVFCSPPYAFYFDRESEMLQLISSVMNHAPYDSVVVVEAGEQFDAAKLPGGVAMERRAVGWQLRKYPPALIAVWTSTADRAKLAPSNAEI